MPTQSLTVTYQNSTVNVSPSSVTIRKNDSDTLEWGQPPGQTWTFYGIKQKDGTDLPNPPFSNLQVSNTQISVTDANNANVDHGTWSYQVGITVDGSVVWSDPQIINKGDG